MFESIREKAGLTGDQPKPDVASVARGSKRSLGTAAQCTRSEHPIEVCAAEAAARRVTPEQTEAVAVRRQHPPVPIWEDNDIAAAAAARLGWHKVDPSYQVEVSVDKGWITLGGHVDWEFQKNAVDQDVRRLLGVTGVTNNLEICLHGGARGGEAAQ